MISEITHWDRFIIYVILPFLAILPLLGTRIYFNNKKPYYQQNKEALRKHALTRHLIIGNLGVGLIICLFAVALYLYILNINLLAELHWELLTIFSIAILSYLIGIGFGSHITAISIKMALHPSTFDKNSGLEKIINFFHYPFSHKFIYAGVIMILYILCLLDLFRGKSLPLTPLETTLCITAGIAAGTVGGLLFIITKSQTFILKVCTIFIVSLFLAQLNESRTIWAHPIALMVTTTFTILILGIALQKQSKINARQPIKKAVKYWLKWDIDQI